MPNCVLPQSLCCKVLRVLLYQLSLVSVHVLHSFQSLSTFHLPYNYAFYTSYMHIPEFGNLFNLLIFISKVENVIHL